MAKFKCEACTVNLGNPCIFSDDCYDSSFPLKYCPYTSEYVPNWVRIEDDATEVVVKNDE